jgi:hypothetical protein
MPKDHHNFLNGHADGAANGLSNGAATGYIGDQEPPDNTASPRQKRPWGLIAFLFFTLFAAIYWAYKNYTKIELGAPFEGKIETLAALQKQATTSPEEPYLRAKLLIMKSDTPELDALFFSVPEEIRAQNLEEVGSVAFIHCGERNVGEYTNGSPAIQLFCGATLIDNDLQKIVGQKEVLGPPPQFFTKNDSGSSKAFGGAANTQLLLDWMLSLPRR